MKTLVIHIQFQAISFLVFLIMSPSPLHSKPILIITLPVVAAAAGAVGAVGAAAVAAAPAVLTIGALTGSGFLLGANVGSKNLYISPNHYYEIF